MYFTSNFGVLGHCLAYDGRIRPCWQATRSAMWTAFWANSGHSSSRCLSNTERAMLVQRAVRPLLDFRCSRWPFQKEIAKEIDRTQRKMMAVAVRTPRWPGEPDNEYARRRATIAGAACRSAGLWSQRWAHRVLAWAEHLQRPRNGATWAAVTYAYRDQAWRARRRAELG